jgi:membrane protein involved in colicin uptake
MRVFIVSAVLAFALMAILASSSFARTTGHFPEGVSPPACEVLADNEAAMNNPPVMTATGQTRPIR